MKKVVFNHNGQRLVGASAILGTTTWFSLGGEVWTTEARVRGRRGKSSAAGSDPSSITAPMPGKIVKVMVQPGSMVTSGDVVIVMEAMKMEYTLKAAANGKIQSIKCQVGEQVALGSSLVSLEVET